MPSPTCPVCCCPGTCWWSTPRARCQPRSAAPTGPAGSACTSPRRCPTGARWASCAPITLHRGLPWLRGEEEPYPEPFDVPPATARLVNMTRQAGGRVIAVGTTVVRALESAALNGPGGELAAASGWTHHVVTPETGVHVVDGLFTGLHEPRSSHLHMLNAFAGEPLLRRCYAAAIEHEYLWHEFGDVHLLLPCPGRSAPFCLPRGRSAAFARLGLGARTPPR